MPSHAIESVPPRGRYTSTGDRSRPRRMPPTTAAQAPVPQASVSPAPRSHTRRRMRVCVDDLHEAGVHPLRKARMRLDPRPVGCAPARRRRRRPAAPRADCPSRARAIRARSSRSSGHSASWCSVAARARRCRNGTRAGSNRGAPMSTVTSPSAASRGSITPPASPPGSSACRSGPDRARSATKQRAPLPHCSTSPPSALKMR